MNLSFPILLCLIAGSLIFFLISLYYIVKFAVRDGMIEAYKRTGSFCRQKKDDRHE